MSTQATNDHSQLTNRNVNNQHMAKAISYGGIPLNQQLDAMKANIADRPTGTEIASDFYNKNEIDARLAEKASADHNLLNNRDTPDQHSSAAITYDGRPLDIELDSLRIGLNERPTFVQVSTDYYNKGEIDTRFAEKAGTAPVTATENGLATPSLHAFAAYSDVGLTKASTAAPTPGTVTMQSNKIYDGRHYIIGFMAPKDFAASDLILINGKPVTVRMADGGVPPDRLYVEGVQKIATLDTTNPSEYILTFDADPRGMGSVGGGTRDAVCTTVGARHELAIAGLSAPFPNTFTVRTVMDADYSAGNVFTIGTDVFEARTPANSPAATGAVKSGAAVEIVFDSTRGLAFFKTGVGEIYGNGTWNISVGGETPVNEGIHIPDAVRPAAVHVDHGFRLFSMQCIQAEAGQYHSVFLLGSGKVLTSGYNQYGQLGRTVISGRDRRSNLGAIPEMEDIKAISAGNYHTLFLRRDGRVLSCGNNNYGQLGRAVSSGDESSLNLGVIPALDDVIAIAAGDQHSLFLRSDGTVWSCGFNYYSQLGRVVSSGGENVGNLGKIPDLPRISAISSGTMTSFFVTEGGSVWSCGCNSSGELGRIVANGSTTVVNLGIVTELTQVCEVNGGNFTLFRLENGEVWSCGNNTHGQLGRIIPNGSPTECNLGIIPDLSGVAGIYGHYFTSLFRKHDGTVWSCGYNPYGQLGRGVATGKPTVCNLGEIDGLENIATCTSHLGHSLFVQTDGTVRSCGQNSEGQLGRIGPSGDASFVNWTELDWCQPGTGDALRVPYGDGDVLISYPGLEKKKRVCLYDDGVMKVAIAPTHVFQVAGGVAVEKTFVLRKGGADL